MVRLIIQYVYKYIFTIFCMFITENRLNKLLQWLLEKQAKEEGITEKKREEETKKI